jgi:hypothetical protein
MNRAKSVSFRQVGQVLPLCVALALCASPACSASSGTPPVLGDCKAGPDASCATSSAGGGGGGSGSGGGGSDSGGTTTDGGEEGCGTAGSMVNGANSACEVCISTSCCMAAAACTGQCLSLVTCATGAGASVATCEANYSQGVAAYNDFGACVATCAGCPTLPTGATNDI